MKRSNNYAKEKNTRVRLRIISLALICSIMVGILNGCSKIEYLLNGEKLDIKNNFIVTEADKSYINVKSFLESRNIEMLNLDDTYTYIIDPSLIVTLDTQEKAIIVEGQKISLDDEDFIIKDGELLINTNLYEKVFEENIVIDEEGKKINIISKYEYSTPDELTLYDYITNNYDEEKVGRAYKENYNKEIMADEDFKIINSEEAENDNNRDINGVHENILKAYNASTSFYDMYNQFQIYGWKYEARDTNIMGCYDLIMNLETFFDSIVDLEGINNINDVNELTLVDIEYISRINTIISAVSVEQVCSLEEIVEIFADKLSEYDDGGIGIKKIYDETLAEVSSKYDKAIRIYKSIKIPNFAGYKSIIKKMSNIENIKNAQSMEGEVNDTIKGILEFIENNPYEKINKKMNGLQSFLNTLLRNGAKNFNHLMKIL